ncbi:MFS transporter [Reticulibacter mediterranei]|uniref:MFS transporter n=1 Tax=Reticulibacter mediterranei TaxID=2778369 RepID=A0A8J3N3H0_9CHLR|nr:MFS transporter [Reticulibacter mediterranei]GHO94358.1 MFS transporter [Reticulibacter mediterranei]
MPSVSDNPEMVPDLQNVSETKKRNLTSLLPSLLHLPKNVYLLLFFTTGKGMQLTIATLTVNLYAHSLGYHPDFIGVFSAMPAIGAMVAALPVGLLADRWGRKPVLIISAILTPLFLMALGLVTSAPWLLIFSLLQGLVSTAYWVTNLPLLTESTTERQRVGVLALNSFLLLGVGALGNLLGGAIPEFVGHALQVSADSTVPLRWGVITAAIFTLVFGLPLWFLHEPARTAEKKAKPSTELEKPEETVAVSRIQTVKLFGKLLLPDLLFTMGEGAVVALMQLYFVLRFQLLPGTLGIIFTISGLAGGIFSLTAPLFVRRWSKLRIITTVQYLSAPLMLLIGFAPTLPLAIAGEYTRSFARTLIEPVYAAFAMEQVSSRQRATLSGLYSVTWSIGFSIGPTIAGWLQTQISLSASFVFGAFCLLICPSVLLFFFGRRKSGRIEGNSPGVV